MSDTDIGTPLLSVWDGTGTWQAVTGPLSEGHAAWVADEVAEKAAKAIYAVTKREVMEALMEKALAEPENPPSLVIPLNVLRGLLGKIEMCQHRCRGTISEFNGNREWCLDELHELSDELNSSHKRLTALLPPIIRSVEPF